MADLYNPVQYQQVLNWGFYIMMGVILLVTMAYFLFRLYRKMSYTHSVDILKRVGDTEIQSEDMAKLVKFDDEYLMHYDKLNKFSPKIDEKYMRIKTKEYLFGIIKRSKLHFTAFLYGESLFPVEVSDNPHLTPMNLDLFNYMQSRIKEIDRKYVKREEWKQLLPYIALGSVVLMFILGFMFWGKHIESISQSIIGSASEVAKAKMEALGTGQVVLPAG